VKLAVAAMTAITSKLSKRTERPGRRRDRSPMVFTMLWICGKRKTDARSTEGAFSMDGFEDEQINMHEQIKMVAK
jgi:hypothetical protein